MENVLTIPKNLIRRGELVIVPRVDYERVLRLGQRLLWEEQDTDEAIRVFEQERGARKLKVATSFSAILGMEKARRRKK